MVEHFDVELGGQGNADEEREGGAVIVAGEKTKGVVKASGTFKRSPL